MGFQSTFQVIGTVLGFVAGTSLMGGPIGGVFIAAACNYACGPSSE